MTPMIKIASLEDDLAQGKLIHNLLEHNGYSCELFTTGNQLISALVKEHDFDLILLDWEIPDISGLDVLHWIRSNHGHSLPIMFITNRITEEDIATGLNAGADDYITKPLSEKTFLARVNALIRRNSVVASTENQPFTTGIYHIDPVSQTIKVNGEETSLAPKEFDLALLFFRNPGRLFSRDILSFSVWNRDIPATSRTLDTHLSNVRRKLKLHPENGVRLHASYALGYRLELIDNELD